MRHIRGLLPLAAVIALIAFLVPTATAGSDTSCVGTLTAGTFDNVVVPAGQSCTLTNSTVKGNVKALENSALDARDNSIGGNVQGDKAENIDLHRNSIGGNVELKEGESSPSQALDVNMRGNKLSNGNIKVEKMRGDVFIIENAVRNGNVQVFENVVIGPPGDDEELRVQVNRVSQDVQVFKTKGNGPKFVTGNTVGQNLQCKENDSPFTSTGNTAGKYEDQCPA